MRFIGNEQKSSAEVVRGIRNWTPWLIKVKRQPVCQWLHAQPFGLHSIIDVGAPGFRRMVSRTPIRSTLSRHCAKCPEAYACLRRFAETANPNAIIAILTTAEEAAVLWPELSDELKFQLWVAVKLREPREIGPGHLPEQHAALLILSKYRGALQHTKTRIAYTYCPVCEKTTKDYGGKKHTYHAYGTLLSDVWRDIDWLPEEEPIAVAERLADLFGLPPHKNLRLVNLMGDPALQPKPEPTGGVRKRSERSC